jgi:release factor glutamine methyltransferase
MTITSIEIPTKNVVSVVHFMRQELSIHYSITEIEGLINYSFKQILGFGRIEMIMQAEKPLSEDQMTKFSEVLHALKRHVPVQYIFGRTTFYGLEFLLTDDVLIPRPETEELVHWILNDSKGKPGLKVMDIGTGSGCIAVTLKTHLDNASVTAMDISEEALTVAGQNAIRNRADVDYHQFDILSGKPFGFAKYDVIVSNPPYVTHAQSARMKPNVLNYEPHLALFVEDENPLIFYKAILSFCEKHLHKGGAIYLEINEDFGQATVDLLQAFNFTGIQLKKDLNGKFRMVKAIR